MKKSHLLGAVCACAITFTSLSANAALISRLGGLAIFDTGTNLLWLTDANYAKTSGYDADGLMNWADANAWAAGLDIDGVAGADGWRLPNSDTCIGNNCSSSEMGNLFYNVLGGSAGSSISTTHNANYGLFSGLPTYFCHRSATEIGANAYDFFFEDGTQNNGAVKTVELYAWAVHSGDVDTLSSVPVPAAVWLFGSGLLGLIGVARRKKA